MGTSAGGGSYSPALTDFVVMTKSATMFLTGPKVVKEALGEEASAESLGGASVHERNGSYWRSGLPYFDTVTIIDFPDVAAQVNALRGGQIDAMTDVPAAQITVVTGQSGLAILEGQGADWRPLCMAIDMPPFDNNDVRQAFRLIVDRNAMLQQVFSGHGRVANDLYSPFDPAYDSSLPQRHQDIAQAKSLLKAAGQENLKVTMVTAPVNAGVVEMSQVFATQAKQAGVTVNGGVIPLFLVSPTRINSQLPLSTPASSQLIVYTPGGVSDPFNFKTQATAPAVVQIPSAPKSTDQL